MIPQQTGSRQVAWFKVYEFVEQLLAGMVSRPAAGTPEWCALPDTDPRKLAAVLDAGVHWTLRIDTEQEHRAEASKDVSAAADWSAVGRRMLSRNSVYIPRRIA